MTTRRTNTVERSLELELLGASIKILNLLPIKGRQAQFVMAKEILALVGSNEQPELMMRRMNQVRLIDKYLEKRCHWFNKPDFSPLFDYQLSEEFVCAQREHSPAILLFWHAGIMRGLFSTIKGLVPDITLIKSGKVFRQESIGLQILETDDYSNQPMLKNASLLKSALRLLQQNGMIGTFLDGTNGSSAIPLNFFNHVIDVQRGVGILARKTGAPVFPCVSRWDAAHKTLRFIIESPIDYSLGSCLSDAEWETRFLQSCLRRFQQHLKKFPEDMRQSAMYLIKTPAFSNLSDVAANGSSI